MWKSLLLALLWHEAGKGKPVSPQIANVRRLFGTEVSKSRVLPAAAGVTGDFKTVEQQDPMARNLIITVEATRIAALVNKPQKRFLEIDKTMIVINGDIFEHLATKTMCPRWLYEEMARADTLMCRSRAVVDNMYEVLHTETERGLNDDFNAPRIGNMLRFPIFSWPSKAKPAGDHTLFNVRWLSIASPDSWSRKVRFRRGVLSLREASCKNCYSLQILNYLTLGPTQVQEMAEAEVGGPLPTTHVMWYFDPSPEADARFHGCLPVHRS